MAICSCIFLYTSNKQIKNDLFEEICKLILLCKTMKENSIKIIHVVYCHILLNNNNNKYVILRRHKLLIIINVQQYISLLLSNNLICRKMHG